MPKYDEWGIQKMNIRDTQIYMLHNYNALLKADDFEIDSDEQVCIECCETFRPAYQEHDYHKIIEGEKYPVCEDCHPHVQEHNKKVQLKMIKRVKREGFYVYDFDIISPNGEKDELTKDKLSDVFDFLIEAGILKSYELTNKDA